MPTWTVLYRYTAGQIQTITVYAYSPLGASREAERLVGDDITVLNCVKMTELTGNDRYRRLPRRRGDIYCSPWCGANCKLADYHTALANGSLLAARLGPGWRSVVWENMGWFHKAEKGNVSVNSNWGRGDYSCFFNCPAKQVVTHGDTPKAAVAAAIVQARSIALALLAEAAALD